MDWSYRPLRSISQKSVEARLTGPEDKIEKLSIAIDEHMTLHPNDAEMKAIYDKIMQALSIIDEAQQMILDNKKKENKT